MKQNIGLNWSLNRRLLCLFLKSPCDFSLIKSETLKLYGYKVLGGKSWQGNCLNQLGYKALSIYLSQLLTMFIAFSVFFFLFQYYSGKSEALGECASCIIRHRHTGWPVKFDLQEQGMDIKSKREQGDQSKLKRVTAGKCSTGMIFNSQEKAFA